MVNQSDRYYGLDALRAFAMCLGVILHAMTLYIFSDDPDHHSPLLSFLFLWILAWRMPVFFLLVGFFTALAIKKWGAGRFLADRMLRIGLTFVIFLLMYQEWNVMGMNILDWELNHLWFLAYLLLFYPVAVLARPIPLTKNWLWLWLIVGLLLAIMGKEVVFFNRHSQILRLDLWNLAYAFYFIFLGWALYAQRSHMHKLKPWAWAYTIASLILTYIIMWLSGKVDYIQFSFVSVVLNSLHLLVIFLAMIGLSGLALRNLSIFNPVIHKLVEWSYPVYVLHFVFIESVFGLIIIETWAIGPILGTLLVSGKAFVASVVCYYLFIKFTPVSWLFNGVRKSWWKWPFKN